MGKNIASSQTHFIGLLVPEELEDTIAECRDWMAAKYGCKSGYGTPPHITIIPPFVLPREQSATQLKKAIVHAIDTCIHRKTVPFRVHVKGFGAFAERTLFAHVEAAPQWDALHTTMLDALSHDVPGAIRHGKKVFVPHLTVANRDIPAQVMDVALKHCALLDVDTQFNAQTIALFERNGTGGWNISECFSVPIDEKGA